MSEVTQTKIYSIRSSQDHVRISLGDLSICSKYNLLTDHTQITNQLKTVILEHS